ncbi:hypothetical protein RHMOL_Rhmol04G0306400 [Rhododendron molle]|uniref:Uncharacterized protein n=1 Tax=Rhododendron molle TaxID=49168 RepID=A0ACC0P8I1_RHOML|nr:hypothetical protein RHMOL_Rhmol04G0306400 [Rhododendron molle]
MNSSSSSSSYRRCNLLPPPHPSSCSFPIETANLFRSHSHTRRNLCSYPSSTITSPPKNQPKSRKQLPKSRKQLDNLRAAELFLTLMPRTRPLPRILEINKALGIISKLGKYSTSLSHFNKLKSQDIVRDLYTFSIAIKC